MIIIDHQQDIENFLQNREAFGLSSVHLNIETYERANGLEEDLLLLHGEVLQGASELFRSKLAKQRMVAVFEKTPLDKSLFPENAVMDFGPRSSAERVCRQLSLLDDSLKQGMALKSQLLTLNRELSETLGIMETELLRVKKVYEEGRPKRFQNVKGVKALSKYAAGDSVGGEFFDLFKNNGKIFLLMSDTSSYLASSSILQIFSDFKTRGEITAEAELELLEEIRKEGRQINSGKKKRPLQVAVMTGILDLGSYRMRGHVFGEFRGVSSDPEKNFRGNSLNFLEAQNQQGSFELAMDRGERMLLLSPGFSRNWDETSPEVMIETLMNNKKIKLLDILDEIFFQLKKESRSGFLSHDASAILLEVHKNVMLQV